MYSVTTADSNVMIATGKPKKKLLKADMIMSTYKATFFVDFIKLFSSNYHLKAGFGHNN